MSYTFVKVDGNLAARVSPTIKREQNHNVGRRQWNDKWPKITGIGGFQPV
jgi:hypothetical protein